MNVSRRLKRDLKLDRTEKLRQAVQLQARRRVLSWVRLRGVRLVLFSATQVRAPQQGRSVVQLEASHWRFCRDDFLNASRSNRLQDNLPSVVSAKKAMNQSVGNNAPHLARRLRDGGTQSSK